MLTSCTPPCRRPAPAHGCWCACSSSISTASPPPGAPVYSCIRFVHLLPNLLLCACLLCDPDPAWLSRPTSPVYNRCSSYSSTTTTTTLQVASATRYIYLAASAVAAEIPQPISLDIWTRPKIISRMTTRNREQTLAFRYLPFASALFFVFCFWRFGSALLFDRCVRFVSFLAFWSQATPGTSRISRPLETTLERPGMPGLRAMSRSSDL